MADPQQASRTEDGDDDLVLYVQAYACTIFRDDAVAESIESGTHLRALVVSQAEGAEPLMLDRFDARCMLDPSDFLYPPSRSSRREDEKDIAQTLDALRYDQLPDTDHSVEVEGLGRFAPEGSYVLGNEPGLGGESDEDEESSESYGYYGPSRRGMDGTGAGTGQSGATSAAAVEQQDGADDGSDEKIVAQEVVEVVDDFEPDFEVPDGITCPETATQHMLMVGTAKTVRRSPQLEVLLRLKQADNPAFAFLSEGDPLHGFFCLLKTWGDEALGAEYEKQQQLKQERAQRAAQAAKDVEAARIGAADEPSGGATPVEEGAGKDTIAEHAERKSRSRNRAGSLLGGAYSDSSDDDYDHGEETNAAPSGVVRPGRRKRGAIATMVAFTLRNGPAFEERVRARERLNPAFDFLLPWNKNFAFYKAHLAAARGTATMQMDQSANQAAATREGDGEPGASSGVVDGDGRGGVSSGEGGAPGAHTPPVGDPGEPTSSEATGAISGPKSGADEAGATGPERGTCREPEAAEGQDAQADQGSKGGGGGDGGQEKVKAKKTGPGPATSKPRKMQSRLARAAAAAAAAKATKTTSAPSGGRLDGAEWAAAAAAMAAATLAASAAAKRANTGPAAVASEAATAGVGEGDPSPATAAAVQAPDARAAKDQAGVDSDCAAPAARGGQGEGEEAGRGKTNRKGETGRGKTKRKGETGSSPPQAEGNCADGQGAKPDAARTPEQGGPSASGEEAEEDQPKVPLTAEQKRALRLKRMRMMKGHYKLATLDSGGEPREGAGPGEGLGEAELSTDGQPEDADSEAESHLETSEDGGSGSPSEDEDNEADKATTQAARVSSPLHQGKKPKAKAGERGKSSSSSTKDKEPRKKHGAGGAAHDAGPGKDDGAGPGKVKSSRRRGREEGSSGREAKRRRADSPGKRDSEKHRHRGLKETPSRRKDGSSKGRAGGRGHGRAKHRSDSRSGSRSRSRSRSNSAGAGRRGSGVPVGARWAPSGSSSPDRPGPRGRSRKSAQGRGSAKPQKPKHRSRR